jgi:diguanylate cyclase (GGDEF)-like protein
MPKAGETRQAHAAGQKNRSDETAKAPLGSLSHRFALLISVAMVALLLLLGLAQIFADNMRSVADAKRGVLQQARIVSDLSGADMNFREIKRLRALTTSMAAQYGDVHVSLFSTNGAATVSAGENLPAADLASLERALTVPASLTSAGASYQTPNGIGAVVPVVWDDQAIASVLVWRPNASLALGLFEVAMVTLAACAFAIALAIWLAYALASHVTGPLRQLTEFARKASSRDLSMVLDIKTGDELEELSRAFNTMVKRIETSSTRANRLAYVDPVTDLPNRDRFMREVEGCLTRSVDGLVMVAVMDLNRFRWINETLGPQLGDQTLAAVGNRLSSTVTTADRAVRPTNLDSPSLIARIGSDEFALLCANLRDPSEGARIVQHLVGAMRQPVIVEGHSLNVSLSVGVAFAPRDGKSPQELIKHADLALKASKRDPEHRVRQFTPQMNRHAMERLKLETDLRAGVERGEIFAVYQPKIDFETNTVIGVEALARWQRGDQVVAPGAFIELAEEIGLIDKIGEQVLMHGCRAAAEWRKQGLNCKLAVNVSPKQFERSGLADKVLETLRQTGLPPSLLELEITESMAVSDPERVSDLMRPLRAMGVRLAIDDFGAGHSNLVTLTRLPFDVFKIDQQFVRALHDDAQAPAIVEMILAMAEAMKLETVAEGVETTAQADFLRRRGCTLGQGYLFSPPIAEAKILPFIRQWNASAGDPRAVA